MSLSYGQDWGVENGYKQLIDELSSPPTISYQSVFFISAADTNWKYKKGTAEASIPINLWRELDFEEDEESGYKDKLQSDMVTGMTILFSMT